MSSSTSGEPSFSNNPYAPDIPYWLYFAEKTNFAGFLIGAIFYGTQPDLRVGLDSPAHFVCPVGFRDRHRPVLPMHGRVVQLYLPGEDCNQVELCRLRFHHVLVRDDLHCYGPQPPVHFLHRQPRIPRQLRFTSWASRIPVPHPRQRT